MVSDAAQESVDHRLVSEDVNGLVKLRISDQGSPG
jgi:hypothetical protein